jgi:bacterioferritin-associated ferredoxin
MEELNEIILLESCCMRSWTIMHTNEKHHAVQIPILAPMRLCPVFLMVLGFPCNAISQRKIHLTVGMCDPDITAIEIDISLGGTEKCRMCVRYALCALLVEYRTRGKWYS